MNYHPILVHFPIALLTIYSLMELVRFKKILSLPYWFYLKATFLIIGAVSAWPTILSGLLIEEQFAAAGRLLYLHKTLALTTTGVYSILAGLILITVVGALAGLILITVVGALGGVIAFGLALDPMTDFIYGLFF